MSPTISEFWVEALISILLIFIVFSLFCYVFYGIFRRKEENKDVESGQKEGKKDIRYASEEDEEDFEFVPYSQPRVPSETPRCGQSPAEMEQWATNILLKGTSQH